MNPRQFLAFLGWFGVLLSVQAAPLTDAHGDPLPKGATARIGTVRLRHGGTPSSMAFTPDGTRLVSTDGNSVAVWDVRTGRSLLYRSLPKQVRIESPAISPDGRFIACWLESGVFGVMETESGKQHCELPCKDHKIYEPAFSRDNRWLVSTNDGWVIHLWDLKTAKLSRQWKSPNRDALFPGRCLFTPDGRSLLHSTLLGDLLLWDLQTGKEWYRIKPNHMDDSIDRMTISPNGEFLATESRSGRVRIREVLTGRFVHELSTEHRAFGPAFSPDSKKVYCGGEKGEIGVWDAGKARRIGKLESPLNDEVELLVVSPDGKYLAGADSNHSIRLWDLNTKKVHFPRGSKLGGSVSAVILSDGKTLLTTGRFYSHWIQKHFDPHFEFWNLRGESLKQTALDPGWAHVSAISPDSATVALAEGPHFGGGAVQFVANKDLRSSLRLYELTCGKEMLKLTDLPCQITDTGFSPDGRYLFVYAYNAGENDEGYDTNKVVQVWKRSSATTLKKI